MSINTEQVIRDYIKDVIHLSLATSNQDKPWVSEVHYAYDENLNLYFRSLPTRRHSLEIAANPNVAGNIVRQHGLEDEPLGVFFEGTAKKLDAGPEQTKAYECLSGRFRLGEEIIKEAEDLGGHQFYKINVKNYSVFGLFDGKGQKIELEWGKGDN